MTMATKEERELLIRTLFEAERGTMTDHEWSVVFEHTPEHRNYTRADAILDKGFRHALQLAGVSDAQVEAAARALFFEYYGNGWEEAHPDDAELCRDNARAALTAAGLISSTSIQDIRECTYCGEKVMASAATPQWEGRHAHAGPDVSLDPEPWHDPRPHSGIRGTLPWGHAQFLPRDGYSHDSKHYGRQFAAAELAEQEGGQS